MFIKTYSSLKPIDFIVCFLIAILGLLIFGSIMNFNLHTLITVIILGFILVFILQKLRKNEFTEKKAPNISEMFDEYLRCNTEDDNKMIAMKREAKEKLIKNQLSKNRLHKTSEMNTKFKEERLKKLYTTYENPWWFWIGITQDVTDEEDWYWFQRRV